MRSSGVRAQFETTTFRALIEREYIARGFSRERWVAKLLTDTGVCRSSLVAAFNGTRVAPATAHNLMVWAAKCHHVDLDQLALMQAPPKPCRKPRADDAEQSVATRRAGV